jgi:hypothetical protein
LADAVLDDLGLIDGADLFEELLQLASAKTGGKLLHEDSAAIPLIFRWRGSSLALGGSAAIIVSSSAGVARVPIRAVATIAVMVAVVPAMRAVG